MKIRQLPNILALHLKRFKYQEAVGRYIKLSYRVVFPFQLRLFNTSDDVANPDRLYELFAVVVHIGTWVETDIAALRLRVPTHLPILLTVARIKVTTSRSYARKGDGCFATTKTSSQSRRVTFHDTLAITRQDQDMSCSIKPSTWIWLAWA
jgi:hypothetical protein